MKFDVIIGNPPYQLNVGSEGRNSSKARAIYHLFVDKAVELSPKYITMIIPSRWMTRTADGIPLKWVDDMIKDTRIKILHDYIDSSSIFPSVVINGGVNYFLWDKGHDGLCDFYQHDEGSVKMINTRLDTKGTGVVIRDINSISILDKVLGVENKYIFKDNKNFSSMVSPKDYFTAPNKLTTNWKDYKLNKDNVNNIKYYVSKSTNDVEYGWINLKQIPRNIDTVKLNKVYISAGYWYGGYSDKRILSAPRYGEPNSACSQTYVVIGYKHNLSEKECLNIISYINTKFFRFMVKIKKNTISAARGVYQFVPLQDWSKPWTDEELYKKYKLTQEEIDYIEETIDPMPVSDD